MKKTAILLIHGFLGSSIEFKNLKEKLDAWKYNTYSFNLSGHGKKKLRMLLEKIGKKIVLIN